MTAKRNYRNASIKEIQNIYLERFSELDTFLKEKGIAYFAIGGTLLGAVRHKGFIPWDDDMDIGMLRKDFEKFKSAAKELSEEHFHVIGKGYSKYYYDGLIKIGLNGTINPNQNSRKRFDRSYHIDVFPLDWCPASANARQALGKQTDKIKKKMLLKCRGYSAGKLKTIVLKAYQLAISPISMRSLACKLERLIERAGIENRESQYIANYMGAYPLERECVPYDCIGVPKYVPFESRQIMIPEKPDIYLAHVYGPEYMKPAQKRYDENNYIGLIEKERS